MVAAHDGMSQKGLGVLVWRSCGRTRWVPRVAPRPWELRWAEGTQGAPPPPAGSLPLTDKLFRKSSKPPWLALSPTWELPASRGSPLSEGPSRSYQATTLKPVVEDGLAGVKTTPEPLNAAAVCPAIGPGWPKATPAGWLLLAKFTALGAPEESSRGQKSTAPSVGTRLS